MCLRAIINTKTGFNMVTMNQQAINSIALSLIHKNLQIKAVVLRLLATICLVKNIGHGIVISAFDNFKKVICNLKTYIYLYLVKLFCTMEVCLVSEFKFSLNVLGDA